MEGELRKGEIVTLSKPGREAVTQSKVVVLTGDRGSMGGVEPKTKFEAISGESKKRLKMVVKVAGIFSRDECFGQETPAMSYAQRYYERWRFLREIGIPTVCSMRIVGPESVAMGDMTRDGSEFFGKARKRKLSVKVDLGVKRKLTEMERKFLAIPAEPVKAEMRRIAEIAREHGVVMPGDEKCEFLVHPDGSWEVIILDLSDLEKVGKNFDIEREVENMYDRVKKTREALERIRNDKKY